MGGRGNVVDDRLPNAGGVAGFERRDDPQMVFVRVRQIVGVLEKLVEERADLAPEVLNEVLQQRRIRPSRR